jgi:uncharacterized protein with PQ loop repeat
MQTIIAISLIGMSFFLVYGIIQEVQKQSGKEPISISKWIENTITKLFL